MKLDNPETMENVLYLHASSVCVAGRALIFLGHSSSGKSTISQLLSRRYPIIADDKVWIMKNGQSGWIAGDAGRRLFQKPRDPEKPDQNKSYPVSAFIRIFKADKSILQPISSRMVCSHLLDAVFEVDIQRKENNPDVVKDWFKQLAEVSKVIPGWRLTFRKDHSILTPLTRAFGESF